jgi:MalT-like TPR region
VRKRIEELKSTLHGFVDQSDDLLLVISARDTDMALVHKIAEGVDQEHPADIVLRFAHEAKAAGPYVDSVVANVDAQIEGVNAVRASEGLSAWPKLPAAACDSRQPHDARLKSAMQHVRGLFPKHEDHRIVWCFLPAVISDTAGYASVIGRLLPRDGIEPWMHSQRIVARDDRSRPFLVPHLHEHHVEGTLVFHADFSTEAMLDGLAQEAVDPETPEPQRMMQILQLAAIDFGYKRHAQAVEKYAICYEGFERSGQPSMQALCLAGVGDVLHANGKLLEAKQRYQQALALSAPDGVNGLPVTMQLCSKTGDTCMARKEFEEAEGYYDMASQIAGKLLNLEYKCDNMEKLGIARASRNQVAGAVEIWKLAIGICQEGDYFVRWRSILDHMIALYQKIGLTADLREVERERAGVARICKERYA